VSFNVSHGYTRTGTEVKLDILPHKYNIKTDEDAQFTHNATAKKTKEGK